MRRLHPLITSGRDLSDSTARTLERRLLVTPDDLDTRLLLIGYWGRVAPHSRDLLARFAEQRRHIGWLIERHPALDVGDGPLGMPFAVDAELAARWREAARRREDDPNVQWNAGRALFGLTPSEGQTALALELLERGRLGAPERAREILQMCALRVGLFEAAGVAADPSVDQTIGRSGLANGFEAFEAATDDDARLLMLWSMRDCARYAGGAEVLSLLRAADGEGNLRRDHRASAPDARHHAYTARGLVALARDDVRAAEEWLRLAAEIEDLPHAPSTALAEALARAAARSLT